MIFPQQFMEHFDIFPAILYWCDLNGTFLGANREALKALGALKKDDVIGKTIYDIYPETVATVFKSEISRVANGELLQGEDVIVDFVGNRRYFTATKSPYYDSDGKIIGLIGTSIEITAQKEADRLRIENEVHEVSALEQEKYRKIVQQAAHDISSPLATLAMIIDHCAEIPEKKVIALNSAKLRIMDIMQHLLTSYEFDNNSRDKFGNEEKQQTLAATLLMQAIAEKRYEYKLAQIKFVDNFAPDSYFACVNIEVGAFKRMISNLINNAADAFVENHGIITINQSVTADSVIIIIEDNGKGIDGVVIDKIRNDVAVTEGKASGHGIGLTQVKETLKRNFGTFAIDSVLGVGTKITLTYPRVVTPDYILQTLDLSGIEDIIILDDDESMHGAWCMMFDELLKHNEYLSVKYFKVGQEVIKFVNDILPNQKNRTLLIADYELLRQNLTGLDVIAKCHLPRAILATSHYNKKHIIDKACTINVKILPKLLAPFATIKIV